LAVHARSTSDLLKLFGLDLHPGLVTGTGDLPEVQLIKLLDLNVDRRTKQHIEILRCLGLVESVVIPESGDRPVPLAPTVASRLEPASLSALPILALCAQGTFSCCLIGSD